MLHEGLPWIILLEGWAGGVYLLTRVGKIPNNITLKINFIALACTFFYVGTVYIFYEFGFITNLSQLSILLRPANLIMMGLILAISLQMGL